MNGKEIAILPKIYDLLLWITPKLDLFPKKYKFIIADKILSNFIKVIELIIEAKYGKDKKEKIFAINTELEKIRFLIRLSKDLNCITIKDYEYISQNVNEIGKMVGGWMKFTDKKI